jgi:hypothetical protein
MKLKDFLAAHETTIPLEWYLERFRLWRASELTSSDYTQLSDSPKNKELWAEYRQALRDFPALPNLNGETSLPTKPQ